MSEDAEHYRARRPPAGKTITAVEAQELQNLYDRLPNASSAAAEALRNTGGVPTAAAFQRFRELDAYVDTIVDRIREILGTGDERWERR
jgi:hypothetical protein